MTEIDDVMTKFCKAGARSLQNYALISGKDPRTAPEYFMPAFIMIELGNHKITTTLETPFSQLFLWNDEARRRIGLEPRSVDAVLELLSLEEDTRNPRVDLVLFNPQHDGVSKQDLDFFALVEFKRGDIERGDDRRKLLRVLPHIDTCPYGIACGWVEGREDYITWQKEKAEECNDVWYQEPVEAVNLSDAHYFFCARLFKNVASPTVSDSA